MSHGCVRHRVGFLPSLPRGLCLPSSFLGFTEEARGSEDAVLSPQTTTTQRAYPEG